MTVAKLRQKCFSPRTRIRYRSLSLRTFHPQGPQKVSGTPATFWWMELLRKRFQQSSTRLNHHFSQYTGSSICWPTPCAKTPATNRFSAARSGPNGPWWGEPPIRGPGVLGRVLCWYSEWCRRTDILPVQLILVHPGGPRIRPYHHTICNRTDSGNLHGWSRGFGNRCSIYIF